MRFLNSAAAAALILSLGACQKHAVEKPADKSPAAAASAPAVKAAVREFLPADAIPLSYEIAIEPDLASHSFKGEATLHFDLLASAKQVVVNAKDLTFTKAALDGAGPVRIEVDKAHDRVAFVFDKEIDAGVKTLKIDYAGVINEQAYGLFYSKFPTKSGEQTLLATQFEPGDARRFAPTWDEPGRKANFSLSVIVDKGLDAISNMPALKSTPQPNGKTRIDFAPTPKMSSYLMFLAVGDFDRITTNVDGVEIGVVARAGEAQNGRFALDESARILKTYNDYFGVKYPLPKLDHFAAPGAGGFGAMENWGAILYFERLLLLDPQLSGAEDKQAVFGVVAHEMAHQWFGDLVTMRWWDDLWLNEGYASWMATKVTDTLHPEWRPWLYSLGGKERAFEEDKSAQSHPIVQPVMNVAEAELAFDNITYLKGEAVIRMIEAYVGADAFREGVRAYMAKNAYDNTMTKDLWTALEEASKAPIRDIAEDFTTQSGVPLIVVEKSVCARGVETVTLRQDHYAADVSQKDASKVWRTPVTAGVIGNNDNAKTVIAGGKPQSLTLKTCGPVKINLQETGYFRTKYADEPFAALAASFKNLQADDQLGLLNDAFALGASGDAPFGRYLELADAAPLTAEAAVNRSIVYQLAGLKRLFEGRPDADKFDAFARRKLQSLLAGLGWDARPGESANSAILRTAVIGGLARFGDAAVIAEARRRFDAYAKDRSTLAPELVETVVHIVGAKADSKTIDALLALARKATSPNDARLYYGAVSNVDDDALADRVMAAIFDKATPAQLSPALLEDLAGKHPEKAFAYYRKNQAAIDDKLGPFRKLSYAARLVGASSDAKTADELEAFAAAHLPAEAKPAVARAADAIRSSANVKSKRIPELGQWLAAKAG